MVIALCTMLCGGETFEDMELFGKSKLEWLKTFLDCFLRWTQSLRTALGQEIVSIDGKALRRALNAGDTMLYMVSAWALSAAPARHPTSLTAVSFTHAIRLPLPHSARKQPAHSFPPSLQPLPDHFFHDAFALELPPEKSHLA